MKAQEIIDGNTLLAKFEVPNWELLNSPDYVGGISTENLFKAVSLCSNQYENLKYHISWNWLMSIVEKIESLNGMQTDIFSLQGGVCGFKITSYRYYNNESFAASRIDATWKGCVEFVKFYNENVLNINLL